MVTPQPPSVTAVQNLNSLKSPCVCGWWWCCGCRWRCCGAGSASGPWWPLPSSSTSSSPLCPNCLAYSPLKRVSWSCQFSLCSVSPVSESGTGVCPVFKVCVNKFDLCIECSRKDLLTPDSWISVWISTFTTSQFPHHGILVSIPVFNFD